VSLARALGLGLGLSLLAGCSSDDDASGPSPSGWKPGVVYPTLRDPGARGLLDRRGLIHAHSVYSHDACDGEPRDPVSDAINQPCLDDFRFGLCSSQHDFVMLTDHNESFGRTEYPDTLLFDSSRGDVLLERNGAPVANRLMCPDSHAPLVLAGCESGTMPVGIERHVAATADERGAVYGADTADAIQKEKDVGAVSLLQHTEDWTVDQLADLPIDGFEMYNLHANTILAAGAVLGLLSDLHKAPEELPYSDLAMLPLFSEDDRYVGTWGSVLARGVKRVTTMATDCHQNTFKDILPDGERIDSYRRMMGWFSNHLLVMPDAQGSFGDLELKEALRAGRLYGCFEVLGFPVGFDYHAESGAGVHEMGDSVSLASGATLYVTAPSVEELDPSVTPPALTVPILKAREGGWDTVAEGDSDLSFSPTAAGAYRAEVRMRPRHLQRYLSSYTDLAEKDFVWIYANPIYVE